MNAEKITSYIAAGLVGAGVAGGLCWYFMDYSRRDIIETGEKFAVISEIEDFLNEKQYPFMEGNSKTSAINGYFKNITDEYTEYGAKIEETQNQTMYINHSGTAKASGFKVDISADGNILITDIVEGSTAEEQGLKVGDIITHIDGVSVSEQGYENYANKILGKDGTKVNLTINRDRQSFDMEFTRAHYYINDVEFEKIGDIEYIKIKIFNSLMQGQFKSAITDSENTDKIIFDLRDTPGGGAEETISLLADICGDAYMTFLYFNGETKLLEETAENARCKDKKIVVLTNEKTASSAEIFTATVKSKLDTTIVGTKTLGKGCFQNFKELSDGGTLKYTDGYFTVGDWECWQGVGISPDITVEMDSSLIGTDDDVQLKKAIELLEKY